MGKYDGCKWICIYFEHMQIVRVLQQFCNAKRQCQACSPSATFECCGLPCRAIVAQDCQARYFLIIQLASGDVVFVAATLVIIVVGSFAADSYCRATGRHDNQRVVIDEVAGYLVTLMLVPRTAGNLLAGFLLFRLFDIWKPPPVRWVDRHVGGGFGVVADDVAAAVYGAGCLWLLHHYGVLGRLDGLLTSMGL